MFPVTLLYGVSKYLFSALGLALVLSLFASYLVAMTVVPLFCANLIKSHDSHGGDHSGGDGHGETAERRSWGQRFNAWFNHKFQGLLDSYERSLNFTLQRPVATVLVIAGLFLVSLLLYPLIGKSYFPRTDPSQFVITVKAPSGTRIEFTDKLVGDVENIARDLVAKDDLKIIVSNIGITPGFSSMLSPNSAPHTAFVQVGLNEDHKLSSFEYMDRVRARIKRDLPQITAYCQTGGLSDAILNQGMPAPIDIQVSGSDLKKDHEIATEIGREVSDLPGVSDILIPQDVDYPSFKVDIDRERASELGLSAKEVIDSLITALTSNGMLAPSYWIDPKSGNNYLLTVQYPENYVKSIAEFGAMPLRAPHLKQPTRLDSVVHISHMLAPTEVDHYQIRRTVDVYVAPKTEDLSRIFSAIEKIKAHTQLPPNTTINIRGAVESMNQSFNSFGVGLVLSVILVYLILVAQFRSFKDPFLILLAVPPGLTGVLLILYLTGTPVNVMSLMGMLLVVGISVSDSILIVEFINRLREEGRSLMEAVSLGPRVRLRPVLMTTLATLIGLIPMAAKLGTGGESYAPLARAVIGGLAVSALQTIYLVPACYLLLYARKAAKSPMGSAVVAVIPS
jgi:multidrug efflux pump subunit AcrB